MANLDSVIMLVARELEIYMPYTKLDVEAKDEDRLHWTANFLKSFTSWKFFDDYDRQFQISWTQV